jgi:coenzyme F420 biosynthesis associated uncharacterized protein
VDETDLVDWGLAERVARWTAARKPLPEGYGPAAVERDFHELTEQAETLVAGATGLRPLSGPARARVAGRTDWAAANVASMRRLLAPALGKVAARRTARVPGTAAWLGSPLAKASRSASGAQLGLVLAYMSTRVLGQYDLLLTEDGADDQDIVYYVGPNVVELEQRHGFDPREFRLWLALHEVTHRAQFTGVPWLRDHFVSLVDRALEMVAADPRHLLDAIARVAEGIRSGRGMMGDVGVIGLMATPEQLQALQRIQALMSLLEGHGDVTMDRAGAGAVPGAGRFSQVLRERRQQARGPAKLLQHLLGLEAKFRQYAEGERFVTAVETAGGTELFDRVWRRPENLPSLSEIRAPGEWVARMGPAPALTG